MLEIIEKCRKAKPSEVKIYLMWSVANWNKVKWTKQSEVEWGEVKCTMYLPLVKLKKNFAFVYYSNLGNHIFWNFFYIYIYIYSVSTFHFMKFEDSITKIRVLEWKKKFLGGEKYFVLVLIYIQTEIWGCESQSNDFGLWKYWKLVALESIAKSKFLTKL